jgi:hypothetical protein
MTQKYLIKMQISPLKNLNFEKPFKIISCLCTFKQGGTKEEVIKSFIFAALVRGMLKLTRKQG